MGEFVLTLDASMPESVVGGKFSKLRKIKQAGLAVPPFFVTTVDFYKSHFQGIQAKVFSLLENADWKNLEALQGTSTQITQLLAEQPLPQNFAEAIMKLHAELVPSGQQCAVRSCMVAESPEHGEDSASNPFAGISETFLCVDTADIIEKMRSCLASGFTLEALLYRRNQGIPHTQFAVCVAVQLMVDAKRSFVAFNCNPNTGAKETLVVAGYGLGEGVVQEKVAVDHFVVRAGKVECQIAEKKTQMGRLASGQLELQAVSPALALRPACSNEELFAISQIASKLSELFSAPQDIEGAFDSVGKIFVLQSRPISFDFERVRLWSSANVSESFPGVSSPLTFSFAQKFYRELNYDFYRKCGISASVLQETNNTFDRLLGYFEGRIFHCITHFHKMTRINPVFGLFKNEFDRLVAELDKTYHSPLFLKVQRTQKEKANFLLSFVFVFGRSLVWMVRLPKEFIKFDGWWQKRLECDKSFVSLESQSMSLLARYTFLWKEVECQWGITLIKYQFMILYHMLLEKWMSLCEIDHSLMPGLLCGGKQLKGVEVVLSAVRLAEMVREQGMSEEFLKGTNREAVARIENNELGKRIAQAFNKHLKVFGARGLQELKLEVPNLTETPWNLVDIVRSYLLAGIESANLIGQEEQLHLESKNMLKKAVSGLFAPLKTAMVLFLAERLKETLVRREHGRYMRSELFALGKTYFLKIAADLVQKRLLQLQSDVFFLSVQEVSGLVEGCNHNLAIFETIDARKKALQNIEARALHELPKEFSTSGIVSLQMPKAQAGGNQSKSHDELREEFLKTGTARGLGSSSGRIVGRARVILEPNLNLKLSKDEILIAKETDPGWLFLMLQVGGIVVERGSVLSHTAITGRKFGIPTVVGLAGVTSWLLDGTWIELDGATGDVTLKEAPN